MEISISTDIIVHASGVNVTPTRQKEKALIAMVALDTDGRRPRAWLQSKLWSDRSTDQRSASLRRALSNIRRSTIQQQSQLLMADNAAVWLGPNVTVSYQQPTVAEDALIEISVKDPEFERWRKSTLAKNNPAITVDPRNLSSSNNDKAVLLVHLTQWLTHPEAAVVVQILVDRLAETWVNQGPIDVTIGNVNVGQHTAPSHSATSLSLELNTIVNKIDNAITVHARLQTSLERYFIWAGQTTLPLKPSDVWGSQNLTDFLNKLWTISLERGHPKQIKNPYFQLQYAVTQLFSSQQKDIVAADHTLEQLQRSFPQQPVIAAWRAFHRITEYLELGGDKNKLKEEACDFTQHAFIHGKTNSLVLSILAQIEMKFNDDPDQAASLAAQALTYQEADPYALSAASHAATLLGNFQDSYRYSRRALQAAKLLPNDFSWDMQAALASMAIGEYEEAYKHAQRSQMRSPEYRAALRYLIALANLTKRPLDAQRYEIKLRKFEPNFELRNFLNPSYPVHTLRTLGLHTELNF